MDFESATRGSGRPLCRLECPGKSRGSVGWGKGQQGQLDLFQEQKEPRKPLYGGMRGLGGPNEMTGEAEQEFAFTGSGVEARESFKLWHSRTWLTFGRRDLNFPLESGQRRSHSWALVRKTWRLILREPPGTGGFMDKVRIMSAPKDPARAMPVLHVCAEM